MPDDYRVNTINWRWLPEMLMSENGDFLQFVLSQLMNPNARKARGQVFAYSWLQSPNGANHTWWMLEFYGSLEYICSTWNPATDGAGPPPSPLGP